MVESGEVVKFGLISGKNGARTRLRPPNENDGQQQQKEVKVVQLSATPRHLMVCTQRGGERRLYGSL